MVPRRAKELTISRTSIAPSRDWRASDSAFSMWSILVARQASMIENRLEQRRQAGLAVQVSGRDCNGTPFTQRATASNVSRSGALLSGLSRGMRSGDLLWVEYEQRKARFRIVWVRDSQSGLKTQAAIQKLETEECPSRLLGKFLNSET